MKKKFTPVWKPHVFIIKYEVHHFEGFTSVRKDAYEVKHYIKNPKNYAMWYKCMQNAIAADFRKMWHDPIYMNNKFYKGMHIVSIESIV